MVYLRPGPLRGGLPDVFLGLSPPPFVGRFPGFCHMIRASRFVLLTYKVFSGDPGIPSATVPALSFVCLSDLPFVSPFHGVSFFWVLLLHPVVASGLGPGGSVPRFPVRWHSQHFSIYTSLGIKMLSM